MQAAPARVDEPTSFLTLLHGGEERGTIFVARKPTANPGDFRNDPYPVSRLDDAAAAISVWSRDAETYASVAVFDSDRRERENVRHVRLLWLDRDEKPLSATLPAPTLTLETSPSRYQDFWMLHAPITLAVAADYARRIASVCGCGNQAVAGNQVLRVPGTINHGVGKDRASWIVRVVRYLPFALYGIGNFKHLAPAPVLAETIVVMGGIVDSMAALTRALPHLDPRMRACAAGEPITRRDGTPYPSESERDQALVSDLVRAGLTDNEIAAAFLETPRGHILVRRKGGRDAWLRLMKMAAKARIWLAAQGFEPWDGVPYVRVGRIVIERAHILGPEGVAMMVALALHANKRDEAWPSRETIAQFLGCSPDLVGDQLRRLRDDLGMPTLSGRRGRAHAHTLIATGPDPFRIPRHHIAAFNGMGPLPVAIMALVAQASLVGEESLTQGELADRLGIRRERVNPVVNRLVDASHLCVAHVGARGMRSYDLAATMNPDVRLSGTNKSHGGGAGEGLGGRADLARRMGASERVA